MKRKTLFLLGLITFLTTSFFTAKAQDTIEIACAKKLLFAIKNRPNPEMFSEDEAWKIISREKVISKDYKIVRTEFKRLKFFEKTNTRIEFYNYSQNWWYVNLRYADSSKWRIYWPSVFIVVIGVLLVVSFLLTINSTKDIYFNDKENDKK